MAFGAFFALNKFLEKDHNAMKVAITVWNRRVSPVFDVCREALILEVENGSISSRIAENLSSENPSTKIERLVALGVETLICGAISEPLYWELTQRKMKVIGFVAGEIEEVLQAFLSKGLPTASLSMPGYCGRRMRFRGGGVRKRERNRQRSKIVN
jgi:predicted Fe-Mo cluster-binding NifX family protein